MSAPVSILSLPSCAEAHLRRLTAWANVNSGSENAAGLEAMSGLLADALRELPCEVDFIPVGGRRIVRARCRPDAPLRVLCNGHYDTVYEADHPFQACRPAGAGILNGPGVADMKGGIVTLLAALAAFEDAPQSGRLGWEVLLTPDEEIGSAASAPALAEAARRNHFGLVFEPARPGGEIIHSRKGTGAFVVRCRGRSAHGAQPEAGRNAILALSSFLLAADRLPRELPDVLLNVGKVRGGGAINIVPDQAEAELHVRITRTVQQAEVLARLHALAARIGAETECTLTVEGSFDRPPKECRPAEVVAFEAWQEIAAELGLPSVNWVHSGGGSDGNLLSAAGLPCLDGVGPIGGDLHSEAEWIDVPSIGRRAQIVALFLHRLATGEIELPLSYAKVASDS
jgi:glutamate carboxypeptidase